MAAGGTAANVHLGPGRLYYAPLGTAEPISASVSLPVAWKVVGYTEDGTTVETEITTEAIEVAEELDPIRYVLTRRTTRISLAMAELAVSKLALAMGAGATRTDDNVAFEFPAPSAMVGVMLVWDSEESPISATNRRWIFREVVPNGTISITRKKAPNKATIPITFLASLPSGQTSPVKVFPNLAGLI